MTNGESFLSKLKSNKDKDANKVILDSTKGTLTGSVVGLGVGLIIGYTRKYNLFISAFLGAAIGGLVTKFLINKD